MPDATIIRGLVDPLLPMGFETSAGIELRDGRTIFDRLSRRVMIVAHPVRRGDMTAVELMRWSAALPPFTGDLLDELIDPANHDGVQTALSLLRNGSL